MSTRSILAAPIVAIVSIIAASALHAAPRVDPFFGTQGIVRIGAPLNNPAVSDQAIDALIVGPQGRVNIIGLTGATASGSDYVISRLNFEGKIDTAYGTQGRMSPGLFPRFTGTTRAVMLADGNPLADSSVVVAGRAANGTAGTFPDAKIFRATPDGAIDASYRPAIEPAGANATPGLAIRPDGRVLYLTIATNDGAGMPPGTSSYVLQQFLPDGTPDPSFGANGRATFAAFTTNGSIVADLAVLADGSSVFAAFAGSTVRIYKVDARGALVPSFGAGGTQSFADAAIGYNPFGPRLLALGDSTLMSLGVAFVSGSSPTDRFIQVVRWSDSGSVISTRRVPMDTSSVTFAVQALRDASVLIARVALPAVATLARLLPDDQFDAAFGGETGTQVAFTAVSAMTTDSLERLIVGGHDATGALVARYRIDDGFTRPNSVIAVEYFNVTLQHYFVSANPAEQRSVESGGAGPGWQRTGHDFRVWVPEVGVPVGARPVCRFYGTPGRGPNSHFHTATPNECAAVKRDPGWTYEGTAFYVTAIDAACTSGVVVWRAYNNRAANNDSNHRYSTQRQLLQAMTPQGWSSEGVAFCGAAN